MKRITVLLERSCIVFRRCEREEFRERYKFRRIESEEEQIIAIIIQRRRKQQQRFSGGSNSLNDSGPVSSRHNIVTDDLS